MERARKAEIPITTIKPVKPVSDTYFQKVEQQSDGEQICTGSGRRGRPRGRPRGRGRGRGTGEVAIDDRGFGAFSVRESKIGMLERRATASPRNGAIMAKRSPEL